MLQRIKAAFDAFRKNPVQEVSLDLSRLTPEQFEELTKSHVITVPRAQLGDGRAEFLGEGTSEEFDEQEKKDAGRHGIFGIGI